jgi:predicted nucleotidyltransferase
MRIKKQEKHYIIEAVRDVSEGKNFDLYLYGSRADDTKAGGDIDLLLVTDMENIILFKKKKHIILANIKKHIGDQRIDLTISDSAALNNDAFLSGIFSGAVKLN